jgi:hypothetical protein
LQAEAETQPPSVEEETSEKPETFDLELDLDAPLVLEEEASTEAEPSPKTDETVETVEEEKVDSGDELIDLLLPTEGEVRVDSLEEERETKEDISLEPEIALFDETPSTDETTPPVQSDKEKEPSIEFEKNAAEIGVSLEDYLSFVKEYEQTAESLRGDLLSGNEKLRDEALEKLTHLANVLRLDGAVRKLDAFKADPTEANLSAFIESIRAESKTEKEEPSSTVQEELPIETPTKQSESGYLYDDIDLSDVKPIHFDFTIEEAANDLSLPAELIEEFIFDFIKQAHEETERMIEAYRKGDLETVQKIGHLLKGTSSNLRITPLADTLYEIQFNDDIERVPELVRNYWAHFLSLEQQMKLHANK